MSMWTTHIGTMSKATLTDTCQRGKCWCLLNVHAWLVTYTHDIQRYLIRQSHFNVSCTHFNVAADPRSRRLWRYLAVLMAQHQFVLLPSGKWPARWKWDKNLKQTRWWRWTQISAKKEGWQTSGRHRNVTGPEIGVVRRNLPQQPWRSRHHIWTRPLWTQWNRWWRRSRIS